MNKLILDRVAPVRYVVVKSLATYRPMRDEYTFLREELDLKDKKIREERRQRVVQASGSICTHFMWFTARAPCTRGVSPGVICRASASSAVLPLFCMARNMESSQ